TADTGGSGGVYVYRVQNVEATTLADLLNALFSTGGKKAPPPAQLSPGRSAVSIGDIASSVVGATSSGTNLLNSSARQLSVGGHQDVQVTADESNNSLLIVATAQAYKTLMEVIAKLDIAPLQVLIDATIVEVDLKDSLEHGIQWFFKHAFGPYTATTTNKFNTGNANTTSGIPLLKDIPYLGWLFSTQTRRITQTELVVLITPRVIEDRDDAILITNEFKRKLTGVFEELEDEKQNGGDQLAGKLAWPWEVEKPDADIGETEKTSSSSGKDLLNEFDMDLEGSDKDLFGELDEFASDTEGPTLLSAANGFNYSVVDSASAVRALLAVLAKQDNINVVSSASLVALNNQEATINVGDKVPIAISSSTNTSGGGGGDTSPIVTNQIQMVDTGVMLKLEPRVNANGMVILNFELENNEAVKTTTSGLDSPTIRQQNIKSTIAVQSGNTIVLGGLIKDKREGPGPGEAELVTQLITNLSGKFRKRYSHFWVKPRGRKGLDKNSDITNLKLDVETWTGRDYWRLDFAGWAETGNAKDRYHGMSRWLQDRQRDSRYVEANQLYLTLSHDDFDVTLGKKVFNNGLSTLFSPADRMKPADLNDPTDPRFLGIWQGVMDYYWKGFSFTGAIFPVYQPTKVPGGPSRWLGSDDNFTGGDFQFTDNDTAIGFAEGIPEIDHGTKNFSYFLRTKASLGGYDFFLSSYYGMNPYWVLRETGDDQLYTKEVVKVGNLAAGVSTTWRAWQFHGEAVYSHSFDGKDDSYLNYVVGSTYVLDDFAKIIGLDEANVTFEYAGEWVHAHQSAESYVASSRTSRVGRNDIFTLVNLTHGDFSVIYANNMEFIYDGSYNKIELQYRMGDGLRSSFALEFFEGADKGGYYGRFRRNHRGIIELEYRF
nr:hypothetical protein [Pseudomonadales bacterium]